MKERMWSDIVAERDPHKSVNDLTLTYIKSVITSMLTHFNKGRDVLEISKITQSAVTRKASNKEQHDK